VVSLLYPIALLRSDWVEPWYLGKLIWERGYIGSKKSTGLRTLNEKRIEG